MKIQLNENKLKYLVENMSRKVLKEYESLLSSDDNENDDIKKLIDAFPETISRISNNKVEFINWDGIDYNPDEGLVLMFKHDSDEQFISDSTFIDKLWEVKGVKTSFPTYIELYDDGNGVIGLLPDYINRPDVIKDPGLVMKYIKEIEKYL